jgi:hypothetical protein
MFQNPQILLHCPLSVHSQPVEKSLLVHSSSVAKLLNEYWAKNRGNGRQKDYQNAENDYQIMEMIVVSADLHRLVLL